MTVKGQYRTFYDDRNVLFLDRGGSQKDVYLCQNYQTTHFKRIHFILCKICLNKVDFLKDSVIITTIHYCNSMKQKHTN